MPVRPGFLNPSNFSWLCVRRRARTSWRQCESRRIEDCDVEDVRNEKKPSAVTQADSCGYGEGYTGPAVREKVPVGVMVAAEGMVIVEVAVEIVYPIRSFFRR